MNLPNHPKMGWKQMSLICLCSISIFFSVHLYGLEIENRSSKVDKFYLYEHILAPLTFILVLVWDSVKVWLKICPTFEVPGRLFPIELNYKPIHIEDKPSRNDRLDPQPYVQIMQLIDSKYPSKFFFILSLLFLFWCDLLTQLIYQSSNHWMYKRHKAVNKIWFLKMFSLKYCCSE